VASARWQLLGHGIWQTQVATRYSESSAFTVSGGLTDAARVSFYV